MPHAQILNLPTCSAPLCVQPSTREFLVAMDQTTGDPITVDYCNRCAERLTSTG